MLRFGAQIAKISNRRKYPLYGTYLGHEKLGVLYILHIIQPQSGNMF